MLNQKRVGLLQVGEQTIALEEVVPLLTSYRMLPHFFREMLIDRTISKVSCTPEERAIATEQFAKKHQLSTETILQTWLERYGMTTKQFADLAVRELLIEKFKHATWESKLETHFLTHKSKFDKVIYSLLRTPQQEIATELYFRIEAGEQTFSELAREYSNGPEAQTGGLIGPVELNKPHPTLAKMLSISRSGQLWSPIQLGEWFVILRLEKFIPAVLNDTMRQQLLNGLFEDWIQEQVQQAIAGMVNLQKEKENSQPLTVDPTPLTTYKEKAIQSTILEAI
jgi:parvulin-like peptidyl-prolyl isomerase